MLEAWSNLGERLARAEESTGVKMSSQEEQARGSEEEGGGLHGKVLQELRSTFKQGRRQHANFRALSLLDRWFFSHASLSLDWLISGEGGVFNQEESG